MEDEVESVELPTAVFIKSELIEGDFVEEKPTTPADNNQILTRQPKTKKRTKKKLDENVFYYCRQCEKRYRDYGHLKRHIAAHGARNFKCTQCDKSFTLKQYLKNHMITHTGERKHRCEVCNKSFTQKGSLNLHKLIHTGQKKFLCTYCKKPFTHQAGLSIHLLIHTSKTKYPCELCKKEFKQKKSMKHHLEFYCKRRPGYVAKEKPEEKVDFVKVEEISDDDDPLKI